MSTTPTTHRDVPVHASNDNNALHADEQGISKVVAEEKPYSVFTANEKWFIVVIIAFAGLMSPFTANIYFPAIPVLVVDFHKSTELINLTVTIYMIMQGISPMLWGTIADRVGRRPIFLACMTVLTLSCVGLALVPTSDYWLLMLLRCIQAAGSASTIALGAGVVADIAGPSERGSFFGLFNIGPMVGPCIGPVIGGALSGGLGWRSIFWFLCIVSALCFVMMLLFLPETLRALVGDGSIRPPPLNRALIPFIGRKQRSASDGHRPPPKPFINPFRLFTYPDVVVLLIFNGIIYAVFYGVTASISTLFEEAYPFLSQTDVGLCFLAIGGGMLFSAVGTGKLLDRDYQLVKGRILREMRVDPEKKEDVEAVFAEGKFPIERARLRTTPIYSFLFIACVLGYGWCLQAKVNIAGPLILQFIIGYVINASMNTISTLLVDLAPSQSASITACNNVVRCFLGAVVVSVIDIILVALGPGWTYVLLGGICIAVCPLLYVEMRWGPVWREERRKRMALDSTLDSSR